MAGRPGFFGGARQDGASEASDQRFDSDSGSPFIRLGERPRSGDDNGYGVPGFDPVWGTLGPQTAPVYDPWLANPGENEFEGVTVDVEVFGNGFQISGQLRTGQFDRLSDWLNMQSGFIRIADASLVHLGNAGRPDTEHEKSTLWVRLDQIVLVAEQSAAQSTTRPNAPVVQKQRRRVTIVTPGYSLRGSIHVHAYGTMKQFLETPDPHFLPMTDLTVRWLSDATMVSHFPFAMVNREQLITVIDEAASAGHGSEQSEGDQEAPLQRWGAA